MGVRLLKAHGTIVKAGVHGTTNWEYTPLYFKELSWVGSNAFGIEEVDGVRKHGIHHYLDLVRSRPRRPERHAHAHLPARRALARRLRASSPPRTTPAPSRSPSTSARTDAPTPNMRQSCGTMPQLRRRNVARWRALGGDGDGAAVAEQGELVAGDLVGLRQLECGEVLLLLGADGGVGARAQRRRERSERDAVGAAHLHRPGEGVAAAVARRRARPRTSASSVLPATGDEIASPV